MKKKLLIPATLLFIAAVSCKKDEDHDHDHEPVITIHEPVKDHFHAGDTMHIHVDVSDEKELHEARIWLIAQPQNDTLWTKRKHSHDKVIEFEEDYIFGEFENEQQKVDLVIKGENAAGKSAAKTFSLEVADHH